MKKSFSLVEIGFVLFIMMAVVFTALPLSVSNINQARLVASWKDYSKQINYSFETFSEFKKHHRRMSIKTSTAKLMEYLDAKPVSADILGNYKYRMMNERFYKELDPVRFDEVYVDVKGRISAIEYEDLMCMRHKDNSCITVWVDLNGVKKPNTVGKDIFAYKVYSKGIRFYGYGMGTEGMREDCSKKGTGLGCSQFYLLGGDIK